MRKVKVLFGGMMKYAICDQTYYNLLKEKPDAKVERVSEGGKVGLIVLVTDSASFRAVSKLKSVGLLSMGMLSVDIKDLGEV